MERDTRRLYTLKGAGSVPPEGPEHRTDVHVPPASATPQIAVGGGEAGIPSTVRRVQESTKSSARLGRGVTCPECGQRFASNAAFCPFDGARLAAAPHAKVGQDASPWVGRVLSGRYQVARSLGAGRVSEVFEAVHLELGRSFAVKVLSESFALEPNAASAFLREAQAQARVDHPGVVRVTDFGELGDESHLPKRPFFVMELCPGTTLRRLLHRGPLDPRRAAHVLRAVADALLAAHAVGVIHRDVKPENIMIDGNDGDRVRVLDFGIARVSGKKTLSGGGPVFGTPEYTSPEQASGGEVSPKSDQYALGVIFFELLTGKLPFTGLAPAEILSKQMYQRAPHAQEANPEVDLTIWDPIVARLLEKRPTRRFESLEGLILAIDQGLSRRRTTTGRRGRVDSVPPLRPGSSGTTRPVRESASDLVNGDPCGLPRDK